MTKAAGTPTLGVPDAGAAKRKARVPLAGQPTCKRGRLDAEAEALPSLTSSPSGSTATVTCYLYTLEMTANVDKVRLLLKALNVMGSRRQTDSC
jgi:hypothetical protein